MGKAGKRVSDCCDTANKPACSQKVSDKKKPRVSTVLNFASISDDYLADDQFASKFQQDLKGKLPFPHWQLHNFVDNSGGIVEDVETELQNFPNWRRKENDLYSLYQTEDFKSIDIKENPALYSFRQFMYGPVREWLASVSGIKLLEQVDMNGSLYSHTDGLLPHSDQIDTRHFAFVYYVTPFIWDKANGGELNLFNADANDEPTDVAVKLPPNRNSFVLFEVSHRSWHRVAEVLTSADPRLSINGWFHSQRRLDQKKPQPISLPRQLPSQASTLDLTSFLTADYLDASKQVDIRNTFKDCSELCLKGFLKVPTLKALLSDLPKVKTTLVGPPNKRNLTMCNTSSASKGRYAELVKLLASKQGVEYFSLITGCDLTGCKQSLTVTRQNQGSYTVVGDEDAEKAQTDGYCLEINLFVSRSEWPDDAGGDIIYVVVNEDEELIHITPESNSLSIVLRDPEVYSFTKYVNSRATDDMYVFSVVFYNVNMDCSDSDESDSNE